MVNHSNSDWKKAFSEYVFDIKSLSGICAKGIFFAPIIAGVILAVGPPWPSKAALPLLTSLAEVLVSISVFQSAAFLSNNALNARRTFALYSTIISFILYICVYAAFVEEMPDKANRDVKGIYLTSDAKKVVAKTGSVEEALRTAGYDPMLLWERWSVYLMRVAVAILWLTFFCAFSTNVALFVVSQRRCFGLTKKSPDSLTTRK